MIPKVTFINSKILKDRKPRVDIIRCEQLIMLFNQKIEDGDTSKNVFHLNTVTDNAPLLNDDEFNVCYLMSKQEGWKLSKQGDNYQSISYKLEVD